VARLKSIQELPSVEALLSKHKQEVALFGPNSFRSKVSAEAALDFLPNGYNVYAFHVEETVPVAKEFLLDVARDLGVAPWQLELEAFAGTAGGVSSRHYDHDTNFQILLDGEKEWELEPNRHIQNPLLSFHPTRDRLGNWVGFHEEAYATDPAIQLSFDPARTLKLHARAGTVLFLPRAYWHQTHSLTNTWSLNVVIKGVTWATALGNALRGALHRHPQFRAYCEGVGYSGRMLSPSEVARNLELVGKLKEAAAAALADLAIDDLLLSYLNEEVYRWNPQAGTREVLQLESGWVLRVPGVLSDPLDLDDEVVPIMRRLAALRYPFTWAHARCICSDMNAISLCNLLTDLEDLELLSRSPS
jgi:Cupin-like domain